MKISYVTTYNAADIQSFSGTGYFIQKMLENQNIEIDYVDDLEARLNFVIRIKWLLYRVFSKKEFELDREPYVAKQYAEQVKMRLGPDSDIIFSPGSIPIAFLNTKKPKVFYTDATFAGMVGFYDRFSNFSKETIKHGNYIEKVALESATLAIYSSEWAAQSAIMNYNANPDKIKVVPFGANMESHKSFAEIKAIISNRSLKECHLLFLGVEWERKGGDIAIKITQQLIDMGLRTFLHIVGIEKFPYNKIPDYAINYGFVNKSTRSGSDLIEKLLSLSHFLLLPSRAEASAVVLCEANSFGLPCITTDVGGMPTIIQDDQNGKKFSLNAEAFAYSQYIYSVFNDKIRYRNLCLTSYNQYKTNLNWEVAGKKIKQLLDQI